MVNDGPRRPVSASTSSSSTPTLGPISSMRPASRAHSSSMSSVHFANPASYRLASGSSHDPFPPTKSATDPSYSTHHRVSPPTTPAPTPRDSRSPAIEAQAQGGSGRRANGTALAHGKRASVVTGGYESSSSESPSEHSRPRRRATTLAFPVSTVPISRSSSDKSLQRDKRLTAISRHSSRDILRSSVLRPTHPFEPNPPSRVTSIQSNRSSRSDRPNPSSPGTSKPKRSQSPIRRELLRPVISSSPDSSKSRKGKERAEPKRDLLASSLGLGAGQGATLTAATAIRLMGSPQTSSIPPPRTPTSSRPSSSDLHHPFLVSAPPALTQEAGHTRDRTISVSTTASPPRGMGRSTSDDIPTASTLAHRRRASSRATLSTDGGHIPFTHHVPPPSTVVSDDGNETEPTPSITVSTPRSPGDSNAKIGKRKRLSSIFGLKKAADMPVAAETMSLESIPSDKEKERHRREADMREKERQRRQDELEEDRYYRALQQVSAHPHCVHRADYAKIHLWALYEHVFDGLENPPRFNPVAILRWKHKVEEQEAARNAWESRKAHLGASVDSFSSHSRSRDPFARWAYTLDDIAGYKAEDGHVEYFIPPREETTGGLASVDELTALEHPASSNGSERNGENGQARAVSNPSSTNLLLDSGPTYEPLSRSPSIEPNRHRKSRSLGGHWSFANHLTGGLIPKSHRQRTQPGDMSDSTMDDSPHRPHQLQQSTSPVDAFHPEPPPQRRRDRLLRRAHDQIGRGSMTDEETRRPSLPRPDQGTPRSIDVAVLNGHTEEPASMTVDPVEVDDEAARKERETQVALYAERSRKLKAAQAGLDRVNASVHTVDDNIRHYTAQLDQIQRAAKADTGYQPSGRNKPPVRSDSGGDRYIRDRLLAAENQIRGARSAVDDLDESRTEAADKLRGMVKNIVRLQAKAGEVDQWARKSMLEIEELTRTRDGLLSRRLSSKWSPRYDGLYSNSARCMGLIVRVIFWLGKCGVSLFGYRTTDSHGYMYTWGKELGYMAFWWTTGAVLFYCWWNGA